MAGWRSAGLERFSGVNVPRMAFGDFVEHTYETPRLAATEVMGPVYSYLGPVIEPHKHAILIGHRDRIFERHLPLPLDD